MGKNITPDTVRYVVNKADREGKLKYEYVGKVDDGGITIAEKMIIFWLDTGVVLFRAKPQKFYDFVCLTYIEEKYPKHCGKYSEIIAEINRLRKEYTSGIWCGGKRVMS